MVEDRKELLERTLGRKELLGRRGRNRRKKWSRPGKNLERTLWLERTLLKEPLGQTGRNQRKELERTLG